MSSKFHMTLFILLLIHSQKGSIKTHNGTLASARMGDRLQDRLGKVAPVINKAAFYHVVYLWLTLPSKFLQSIFNAELASSYYPAAVCSGDQTNVSTGFEKTQSGRQAAVWSGIWMFTWHALKHRTGFLSLAPFYNICVVALSNVNNWNLRYSWRLRKRNNVIWRLFGGTHIAIAWKYASPSLMVSGRHLFLLKPSYHTPEHLHCKSVSHYYQAAWRPGCIWFIFLSATRNVFLWGRG